MTNSQNLQPLSGQCYDYDRDLSIIDHITKQAHQHSNNIALRYQNEYLTYGKLLIRINRLANYLSNKVKPGENIAIYLEPSIDLIIGILAILKIGCCFIPLDISYPQERLNYLLKDSSAVFLLIQSTLIGNLILNGIDYIMLDIATDIAQQETLSELHVDIKPNDRAYIIYTSGSTGVPKGVQIHHQAVNNHMLWMHDCFKFNSSDVFLLRTPVSFDPSIWEILLPLYCGATLVIAPAGSFLEPEKLLELIDNYEITTIQFVPSLLHEFLKQKENQQCNSLKRIFSGGESLRKETKTLYFEKFSCPLYNLYGPTEATIDITFHEVTTYSLENNIIGVPIYNTELYVLTDSMQQVKTDEHGELYIASESLSKGYFNRPEETKERFLENPFGSKFGTVFYRTGDIVKILKDGALEYFGRSNDQVKINGVRIEPNEITHRILCCAHVYDCKVIKRNDLNNHEFLACYIVPKKGKKIDIETIKYKLSTFFPRYMLPKTYTILERFPLNENGKINISALPEPRIDTPPSKKSLVTRDLTKEEKELSKIWTRILKIDDIDLGDNFFELGGDSILSLELLTQIKSKFNVELHIKDIFSCENLFEQAWLVTQLIKDHEMYNERISNVENYLHNSIIPLQPTGNKTPVFLIHPIGGTIFWYSILANLLDPLRPVYGIQDPSIEAKKIMFNSIVEMAECYYKMIKTIQPHGPYIIGGASFGATVAVEIASIILKNKEKILFVPVLDGWAVYPDTLCDISYFEESMNRQYNYSEQEFLKSGLTDRNFLLSIQKNRLDLLWKFSLKKIPPNIITVFKAKETLPVFLEIEEQSNHWQKYVEEKVEVFIVPGNHETMFQLPNVKKLAQLLNKRLNKGKNT